MFQSNRRLLTVLSAAALLLQLTACTNIGELAKIEPGLEKGIVLKRDGKGAYAIPKMIVTQSGSALIALQDREGGDWAAPIHPMMIRSLDSGKSWSKPALIGKPLDRDGRFHVKPTSIVEDRINGTVFVFLVRSPIEQSNGARIDERWFYTHLEETWELGRAVFLVKSDDEGLTWSDPLDVTAMLKRNPHWQEWTPVHSGLQLQRGPYAGRLVVPTRAYTPRPGDNKVDWDYQTNGLIFSDDGGKSWHTSERSGNNLGEASIAELSDGAIYMNQRVAPGSDESNRNYAISRDGGSTFAERGVHPDLPDVKNHAGLVSARSPDGEEVLLFSNVPGTSVQPRLRKGLTVTISFDDGESWGHSKMLEPNHAAYSDLAVAADGSYLCVYETGSQGARESIAVARFIWSWLVGSAVQ